MHNILLVLRSWRLSCWSWRLGLLQDKVLEVEAGWDTETSSSRLRLGILIEGQAVGGWRLLEVVLVQMVLKRCLIGSCCVVGARTSMCTLPDSTWNSLISS